MRKLLMMFAIGGALLGPTALAAQGAWDAPMFMPPHPGEDIGGYFLIPDHYDWGLEGLWRQEGNLNLGLRGGLGQHNDGGTDWFLGAETYGSVLEGPTAAVDISWVLGAGATFAEGGATWLRIPFGVSIGKTLQANTLTLTPYVLPRIAYDLISVNSNNDSELNFAIDLGADMQVSPTVKLRVGGTLDASDSRDFQNFGIGLAFAFGRKVEVR